ncbi:MAG: ribonuclease J [Peptostreptococcaceae bacterium]|nr:ribonuclease J [Peptostreptococcaceae bacterium]
MEEKQKQQQEQIKEASKPEVTSNDNTNLNPNQIPKKKNNNNRGRRKKKPAESLRIVPLGGLKEIGKNITLLEYKNEILIIDCGFTFPEDEMFGVDVVIPDFTYLKENKEKIKGLIITHGHEDHIGGIPFFLRDINVPIYGTKLTVGLIKNKLKEHKVVADLNVIEAGQVFQVGSFSVEAIRTNHSIADALAYFIKCPAGKIIHTGDFKIDYTPVDNEVIDLARFAQLGAEGVDLLLADSTNAARPGFTPTEQVVSRTIDDILTKTEKRVIVVTFSSNLRRSQKIMEAAIAHGRKIAISGRSMENVIGLGKELGYINLPKESFVDIRKIKNIPDKNLLIISTGSQGEPMSALTRMANGEHKAVQLKKNDVVLFSSTPVPGNEKTVTNVVNKLYELDVQVIQSDIMDIHVSGHASREELKLMHTLVKPKFFMPVHGEHRHLNEHAALAENLGMDKSKIFVMNNGDALTLKGKSAVQTKNAVQAGAILVDGYGVGDIGNVVLRDRKLLSESGLIIAVATVDSASGEIVAGPYLVSRGFVYVKDNSAIMNDATAVVEKSLNKCQQEGIKDFTSMKSKVRSELKAYIYSKTKRNPMILPIFMEI